MEILGVDIGGSGIKGAIVDTDSGTLLTERIRIKTPQPATPEAIADTLKELVETIKWDGYRYRNRLGYFLKRQTLSQLGIRSCHFPRRQC